MLRPNRAIPYMKGLSEYFQNITKLKLSFFLLVTMVTDKLSKLDIFCETVACQLSQ